MNIEYKMNIEKHLFEMNVGYKMNIRKHSFGMNRRSINFNLEFI